ncbi:MAG: hypothetical protein IIY70_01070 [Oscillospiraceae bacterium]|nr:hypothetical protein [Oscillospiraceae bacterium]
MTNKLKKFLAAGAMVSVILSSSAALAYNVLDNERWDQHGKSFNTAYSSTISYVKPWNFASVKRTSSGAYDSSTRKNKKAYAEISGLGYFLLSESGFQFTHADYDNEP